MIVLVYTWEIFSLSGIFQGKGSRFRCAASPPDWGFKDGDPKIRILAP